MVIRPLLINMPYTTWLNCRKVVVEITGAMFCKSARISGMGFSGFVVVVNLLYPKSPTFLDHFLAKVLVE
jgi:hypothetical protein